MNKIITKDPTSRLIIFIYLVFVAWWAVLNLVPDDDMARQIFGASYGLMALFGGISGMAISKVWGGAKSLLGRSIILFSLGLLAQEFGQIAYSIYTFFLNVEIPYPSWGDLGYFGSIPLYIYGTLLLARASGAKASIKNIGSWMWGLIIPGVLLIGAYIFFIDGYDFSQSTPMITFLDFGYPFGQAIYVSITILTYLLSRNVLGGVMKKRVLMILLALVVQFTADYMFLYLVRYSTVAPAGVNDLVYLTSYFLLALSLAQFKTVSDELSGSLK